jgi:hypothetical protein
VDGAHQLKALGDDQDPTADQGRVVWDQLHPHKSAARYEACAPSEARRLARRLALPDTPKHGSGLHLAAIALSVLSHQCLHRRLAALAP